MKPPHSLHDNGGAQLALGLLIGAVFGFLLQKGGVTNYDVVIGQLLLRDFTVVKIMLSAVVTGMIGVHLLQWIGAVKLHPKAGSIGSTVIGGLIFGVGFAILGYCPGTGAGAAGQGCLDALCGGIPGLVIGAWLFAVLYPALEKRVLSKGYFGDVTLPQLLRVPPSAVIAVLSVSIVLCLLLMERAGL